MTMGRITGFRPREATTKKKEINPIWRGIGCLSFLLLTIGCYFAADWLITAINDANRASPFLPGGLRRGIPRQYVELINYKVPPSTDVGGVELPRPVGDVSFGVDITALAVTLFLSLLLFSVIALVWAALNPPKLGPKDAPPVRRKIDRGKVR
jgi:hypothetical protein